MTTHQPAPKMKFKPMHMLTTDQQITGDREGASKCWEKGSLDQKYFRFSVPVLVLPDDPDSVRALHQKFCNYLSSAKTMAVRPEWMADELIKLVGLKVKEAK